LKGCNLGGFAADTNGAAALAVASLLALHAEHIFDDRELANFQSIHKANQVPSFLKSTTPRETAVVLNDRTAATCRNAGTRIARAITAPARSTCMFLGVNHSPSS